MNNRITELFKTKKENILSVFFTAGYPELNSTTICIEQLQNEGVDLIEIGIPFSDPIADGEIIQNSSQKALENGMSLSLLFMQLKNIREKIKAPLILMGYLNPVLQFGMENFVLKCKETGIDGIILPDLPLEVFNKEYKQLFEQNNLSMIFIITPKTSSERIKKIDSSSDGFLYLVSSSGTTGKKITYDEDGYKKIKSLSLKNPILIGFGVSDKQSFKRICSFANGAIIGSAFVKTLTREKLKEDISDFISSIIN